MSLLSEHNIETVFMHRYRKYLHGCTFLHSSDDPKSSYDILPIVSPKTKAMKEALKGVGFQETHPLHKSIQDLTDSVPRDKYDEGGVIWYWVPRDTPHAPYLPKHLTCSILRDKGYEGGIERGGVPRDTPHAPNHQSILYGIGLWTGRGLWRRRWEVWGSRRHSPWPKPPKHLTYYIPRDEGYEGGVERCGVPGDTLHALNHLNILPILSPETRAMKEALRGVGFQEKHPMYKTIQASYLFCTQRRGLWRRRWEEWGSRRHTPWTKPAKHLTYSIPRDKGYGGGVERCGVPGDKPHAPNHLNILPILSPETSDMKETLRGVGFQGTHPMHWTT